MCSPCEGCPDCWAAEWDAPQDMYHGPPPEERPWSGTTQGAEPPPHTPPPPSPPHEACMVCYAEEHARAHGLLDPDLEPPPFDVPGHTTEEHRAFIEFQEEAGACPISRFG